VEGEQLIAFYGPDYDEWKHDAHAKFLALWNIQGREVPPVAFDRFVATLAFERQERLDRLTSLTQQCSDSE
jgi:hypothetical protein